MNGVFFNNGQGQGVNRVLGLGQALFGLWSTGSRTQRAPPHLPLRLAPSVVPYEPPVSHSGPRRHFVCQNPCSKCPQKALGPSRRNQFRQGIKRAPKDDPDTSTPQHLRGRMIAQSVPMQSQTNADSQLSRPGHSPQGTRRTWNRPLHQPM